MHEIDIETVEVPEPIKKSKLKKLKSAAITTAIFVGPGAVLAGSIFASYKMTAMQLETAKLNLETARLSDPS